MRRTSIVADDVRSSRELVARWLDEKDYSSFLASDGDAAWEALNDACPDLVVTDIEMPGKSGLELLRQIREHPDKRVRCTPVVVISSLNDSVLAEVVLGMGATAVLAKPLAKTEFQASIDGICRGELKHGVIANMNEVLSRAKPGPISPTLRRLIDQARLQ